ncbi:Uncharacterised protein [Mycobacteroides abscessus subsp. abscessus]|nr:Uncharacterised protein [Mycobacteroides abscessus subsp. abscessus]
MRGLNYDEAVCSPEISERTVCIHGESEAVREQDHRQAIAFLRCGDAKLQVIAPLRGGG